MTGALVQPCAASPCAKLLAEESDLRQLIEVDAKAASGAYEPPEHRTTVPAGYRNATPDELDRMHVPPAFIERPVPPGETAPSNFRAAVFINDEDRKIIVAYQGTTPPAPGNLLNSYHDWQANILQGTGHESFYYTRAQAVGTRVVQAANRQGYSVHFVGHSLGGGEAAAAARVTGQGATTFNAAGLHPDTVRDVVPNSAVTAVHVRGEILTSSQAAGKRLHLPQAANDRDVPLDPPKGYGRTLMAAGALAGIKGMAAAATIRAVGLHLMGAVDRSLTERQAAVAEAIRTNRCR